jgi:hypothetical protein
MDDILKEHHKIIKNLLSQTRVSFLIGAGCSFCAGLPLMDDLTKKVYDDLITNMDNEEVNKSIKLLNEIRERYDGINNVSIEDVLSEVQDIYAILQRQINKGIENPEHLTQNNSYNIKQVSQLLKKIKMSIRDILGDPIDTIEYHRKFCNAVHYGLKQGRDRTTKPINYFILNYDTILEDALALEGISFNDGFVGGATAWWDPSRFKGNKDVLGGNRKLEAHVYKLHGSIDWIKPSNSDLPMRIRDTLPRKDIVGQEGEPVVIYPASIKYKETQHDPYAQMIMNFRNHLSDTQNHVLAVMGYGFNDSHINIEIRDGIKASNGSLSVVIFLGTKELPSCISEWLKDEDILSQILVLGKNSIWKNGEKLLDSEEEIDWYKFEYISELLSGVS